MRRGGCGDDADADPVAGYNQQQALRVGRAVEKLDYYWLEEHFSDYDAYGYQELCRPLAIPIAGTESPPGGPFGTPQYIAQRAVDIVRSDVSWRMRRDGLDENGGSVRGVRAKLRGAHDHERAFGPGEFRAKLRDSELRVCRNFVPQEPFSFGVRNPIRIDAERFVHVPQGPGLGAELDWDALDNTKAEV